MNETFIPIRALSTVTKRLIGRLDDFEIKGRMVTIQTLPRSARIRGRILET